MGGPWEDYGGQATAEEEGPWSDYVGGAKPRAQMAAMPPPPGPSLPIPKALQPSGFTERIGERIHDVGYMVPDILEGMQVEEKAKRGEALTPVEQDQLRNLQAQGAAQKEMVIGPPGTSPAGQLGYALTYGPRFAYSMAKQYWEDPAALAGDVILASPELAEMRVPKSKGAARAGMRPPPTPPEGALAPEQQAKFTADVDRANAQYAAQQAAEQQARRGWVGKAYEAKQSGRVAEAATNRKAALARGQEALATRLGENVRTTHEIVRNSLNQRWEGLRDQMQGQEVATAPVMAAIERSRQMLAGVPQDLQIFNQITRDMELRGAEEALAGGQVGGTLPSAPETIPFDIARTQFSALGEKWSGASGNLRRALKNVYDAYDVPIQEATERAGQGQNYGKLKRDWSQYMTDWQDTSGVATGGSPLAKALRTVDPAYLQSVVTGKAGERLAQTLGKYVDAGGNPKLAAQIRQFAQEATRTKVPKVAKAPAPYQAKTPELAEVKRPQPKPPAPKKPGFMLRHGASIAGKTVGTIVGGAIGHPILGYGAGSEIAGEIANKLVNRRSTQLPLQQPLPPEPPAPAPSSTPPPALPDRRLMSQRVPAEMEHRSGFERRSDVAERQRIAAMTPEQVHQELYTDRLTGIPNKRAFDEAPPAPAYAFTDVSGLKWLNDNYKTVGGNKLLHNYVRALQDVGLEVYRIGGDEIAVRGEGTPAIQAKIRQAQENFNNMVIEVVNPKNGKVERYKGAEFRAGVGSTLDEAEQLLIERKALDKSRGKIGTLTKLPEPPE